MNENNRRSIKVSHDTYHNLMALKGKFESVLGEGLSIDYTLDLMMAALRASGVERELKGLLARIAMDDDYLEPYGSHWMISIDELASQLKSKGLQEIPTKKPIIPARSLEKA